MRIVLDSDVIIAGLISSKGAGRFILKEFLHRKDFVFLSTVLQIKEIKKVFKRDKFVWKIEEKLWMKFKNKTLKVNPVNIKKFYPYVFDKKDAYILAAAVCGKACFLVTYNLRNYFIEKIKEDFDILVFNPGYLIQFCRQQELV